MIESFDESQIESSNDESQNEIDYSMENIISAEVWYAIGNALYRNNVEDVVYFGMSNDEN